jgi:type I restriction enzyme R subunit
MTDASATRFEPIAISSESTVVTEFSPDSTTSVAYQSEGELLANLRVQLEALNSVTFTDDEWQRLLTQYVVGANDGAVQKTVRVQEDHVYAF